MRLIYLITFLSGAAGLMYEITWSRMLILIFGNSTHSVVAVISAFLGGLAIGSLIFGNWSVKKSASRLLKAYCYIEFGIGLSASLTILALPSIGQIYGLFSDGSTLTTQLLLIKFLLTTVILLLPTILMGATLPILSSLLQPRFPKIGNNISLLYGFNTLGAVLGVVIAALFSIELLGLNGTILLGVVFNFSAAVLVSLVPKENLAQKKETQNILGELSLSTEEKVVLLCLFISGLISIAYEILWTRVLTPAVGTFVYAFAFILATYLLGIALGSLIYRYFKNWNLLFALSELGIGVFAFISALIISNFKEGSLPLTLLVVLPASICMGLSYPAANSWLKSFHHGYVIGRSYFINTLGCIIGGLVASFMLIPTFGSNPSIVLLSIGNLVLAILLIFLHGSVLFTLLGRLLLLSCVLITLGLSWLFMFYRGSLYDTTYKYWAKFAESEHISMIYKEDDIASIIGLQGKIDYQSNLLVNGVGITGKVLETSLMAHLPIALHPAPKSILVICFGMGSTYRAALLHKITVDAIELSPSVAGMFSLFYPSSAKLQKNAPGKIIINDGRNYVNLTKSKYDIVTIDPPPPFNAAGTTVLYSEEFYKNMLHILTPQSLVMQWVPLNLEKEDSKMAAKSFTAVFPYTIAIKSPGDENGFFLIGSLSEIKIDKERMTQVFSSKVVENDLSRFGKKITADTILPLITNRQELVKQTKDVLPITDDHPRTEYFLLRQLFTVD